MKSDGKNQRYIILLLAAINVLVIIALIYGFRFAAAEKPVTAGCVLIGERADNGWNESHYSGLVSACRKLKCNLLIKEHVAEEEEALETAVKELVSQGCSVIFLTSYGYGGFSASIARDYPDIAFFCISAGGEAKNLTTYFARMYQARYLAGIAAGAQSKTGILGYVVAMPGAQADRAINAYALGMRLANPEAKLLVNFTGSWDDEDREREAVRRLAAEGADVITYHEDKPYAIDEAEKLGLYSTGYDAVYGEYSGKFLTAALYDWNVVYTKVLGDYLSGRANFSNHYWLGFADNAVDLYPFSDLVSVDTRKLIKEEKIRIQTYRDVFSGVIYDNKGNPVCGEDERIGDFELYTEMGWYAEGVEIYE
ncbi:MAG: BMP family ABC transporter substrate-binding protein [Lachnospiraceae bacterium]|nr:BMP family ABC transporter substrate-binding protein [Lachnospiraceae bacterium]